MTRSDRAAGRPPSLTKDQIIDTAIEMGLKELNMKALAAELGVNVVTLYRHVGSRDALMRELVMRLMIRRRLRADAGKHWAEFIFHYANDLFELFRNEPGLLIELINGNLLPDSEIDVLEQFLEAMETYGFSYEDGLSIHRSIGVITLGSALGAIGINAVLERGSTWGKDFDQVYVERDEEELPAVRDVMDLLRAYDASQWVQTLYTFLVGVGAKRGDSLPDLESLIASQDAADV